MDVGRLTAALSDITNADNFERSKKKFAALSERAEGLAYADLAELIRPLLQQESEFAGNLMFWTGKAGIQMLAIVLPRLMMKSFKDGPESAAKWLARLLSTKEARALVVMPLWGVEPTEP